MREVELIKRGGDGEERRVRQRVEMSVRRGGDGVKRVTAQGVGGVQRCASAPGRGRGAGEKQPG